MLGKLYKLVNFFSNLDQDKILFLFYSQEDLQDYIISLNQDSQLFERGIDSQGKFLGEYSPFTINNFKIPEGLPFDRITLFQNGDFYASFRIIPLTDGFKIFADTIKEDNDLSIEFGKDIIGLTFENKTELAKELLKMMISYVKVSAKKEVS